MRHAKDLTLLKVLYVGTWAAGAAVTRNGANPNDVFRVSAVDELVDRR